jgi:sec-independent protein translocase protein TatA
MELGILFAGLGMWEIILIVLVILLFFGAKRIPDLMKSFGKGVRSFKEGMNNIEKEIKTDTPADKTQEKEKENKE